MQPLLARWGKRAALFGCGLAAGMLSAAESPSDTSSPNVSSEAATPAVEFLRVPGGGVEPRAVVDANGTAQLVYLGGAAEADVFYARRELGQAEFGPPLRVNAPPGTAALAGAARGPQLALGKNGRAHVVWNGAPLKNAPEGTASALWYARLDDAGTAFEPPRNLLGQTLFLDGGAGLAADAQGRVYVLWQAVTSRENPDETSRLLFLARSVDDGKTFAPERAVGPDNLGMSGGSAVRALADHKGALYVLLRDAPDGRDRDLVLFTSSDTGVNFHPLTMDSWMTRDDPQTAAALVEQDGRVQGAWATAGQVYFAPLAAAGSAPPPRSAPKPGDGVGEKYPVWISGDNGWRLLVWTESGPEGSKTGALAWQFYDSAGQPRGAPGRRGGVPAESLAAGFYQPPGHWVVLY